MCRRVSPPPAGPLSTKATQKVTKHGEKVTRVGVVVWLTWFGWTDCQSRDSTWYDGADHDHGPGHVIESGNPDGIDPRDLHAHARHRQSPIGHGAPKAAHPPYPEIQIIEKANSRKSMLSYPNKVISISRRLKIYKTKASSHSNSIVPTWKRLSKSTFQK